MDINILGNICSQEWEIQAHNKQQTMKKGRWTSFSGYLRKLLSLEISKVLPASQAIKVEIFAAKTTLARRQEFVLSWRTRFTLLVKCAVLEQRRIRVKRTTILSYVSNALIKRNVKLCDETDWMSIFWLVVNVLSTGRFYCEYRFELIQVLI